MPASAGYERNKSTMKKLIEVTRISVLEVDVPDELLTDKSLSKFSKFMFEVKSPEQMLLHAAKHAAHFESSNLEGLGDFSFAEQHVEITAQII
jgi:hypothetical protein